MLKGEDRVRKRPAVIFGSDDLEGCKHAVFEILSNAIDEAREGYGDTIIVTRYEDLSVEVEDFGRGCPVDYNEKEKRYNWELVFCEMYAGGKYGENGENYEYSLGLNGLGSCATQYASEFFDATIRRDGYRYDLHFEKGRNKGGLKKEPADRKIAEYRSKLNDSTFSIYADTSRQFNQLLSFENNFTDEEYQQVNAKSADIALLPLFKFSLAQPDSTRNAEIPQQFQPYYSEEAERFKKQIGLPLLKWVNRDSDVPPDSLIAFDAANGDSIRTGSDSWQIYFKRGLSQSLIKQYTSAISNYTAAIDRNPSNPFLYLNRSTTQSEMIDFVSSIDNSFQRIAIESDPANRLKTQSTRTYNYDEAIGDLNKAIKLLPDFAYSYYNRANLYCLSGQMSEALEDYTRAIELNPQFGEAYYNRGLIQIYLKDTHKGCLDMSKAGELGIQQAYKVLKIYGQPGNK